MKNKILLTAVIFSIIALILSCISLYSRPKKVRAQESAPIVVEQKKYEPTHAQTVWLYALEWCESSGKQTAINGNDLDGTPSYYSFQFKPSTFKAYALKYKILNESDLDTHEKIMKQMSFYRNQKAIVTEMLNDSKVRWYNEFPNCTKNKIGLPPRY